MAASFSELLGERIYVSQYGIEDATFVVHKNGVVADADGNAVTVAMKTLDDVTTVFDNRAATRSEQGTYTVTLQSADLDEPGIYKTIWSYSLDGVAQTFVGLVEVGMASPSYDRLSIGFKGIVESAWIRFADLFDSPYGGPHLQVYFQARFTRGRMAQLLQIAVQRLNTIAQPHQTYSIYEPPEFPFAQWGGLLDAAVYIEAIKHLMRSYVEQPDEVNVAVARQDRRDYLDRWNTILQIEMEDFTKQMEVFKIAHMGLGRPAVLVSGGVYGDYGPTRLPGSAVARPRFWARFY